jgi:hypothetical protein
MFVRELVADRDVVFAFAHDGSPAWAMDLDSRVQWWYAADDQARIRAAVAEQWDSFDTLPLVAATTPGVHPAFELGRRVDAAAYDDDVGRSWSWSPRAWWTAVRALPTLTQVGVAVLVALAAAVVVPWLLAFLTSAPTTHHPIDPTPRDAPTVAVAGTECPARGLTSHDSGGHLLVCIPPTEAQSYRLEWRAVG